MQHQLKALPKAPSKYNPYKYPDIKQIRRDLVLKNLFDNKLHSKNNIQI